MAELTISVSGVVKYRVPLSEAVALMSQALVETGSPKKAEEALLMAMDALQRRSP